MSDAPLPLRGIKVLDLSRLLPGPFATMVLGDLGAEVDKVEDPGGGDYLRHMPPLVEPTDPKAGVPAQAGMFLAVNRNKRSCVLDLKTPDAREALLSMVGSYDVLVEQFRPGVMDRLGLSHAALLEKNPRLVVCAITGYGQDGPLAQRAGHDINYLARAGLLGFTGPAGVPPTPPGFQLADIGGALWAVIGVLAALAERAQTGKGRVVDVAMTEASLGFAAASFGLMTAGVFPRRGDEAITGGLAVYGTYATKDDRYVSLGALEPKFWMAFAAAVGLEADMSALLPGPHQVELKAKVAAIFRGKTRDEWAAFSREVDCCLEPVLEPNELRDDAHHVARGAFFDLPSPWGPLLQMRLPVTPERRAHTAPPRQGEHTEAVLREAGVSADLVAKLVGSSR